MAVQWDISAIIKIVFTIKNVLYSVILVYESIIFAAIMLVLNNLINRSKVRGHRTLIDSGSVFDYIETE